MTTDKWLTMRRLKIHSTFDVWHLSIFLHVFQFFRQFVKCWMTVRFVFCRFKKFPIVFRIWSSHRSWWNNPDTDAFHSPGVNIAGIFKCHGSITRVKASAMAVLETIFTSYKYFPEWPILHFLLCLMSNVECQTMLHVDYNKRLIVLNLFFVRRWTFDVRQSVFRRKP